MGLTIRLESEDGQPIQTLTTEFNYHELYGIDVNNFLLLKYIDFYGDTTFNALQLDDLISDFKELKSALPSQESVIEEIIDLALLSKEQVHTYIKFYGD